MPTEAEQLSEEVPKWPLYIAFGIVFGAAPLLPTKYNKELVYLVHGLSTVSVHRGLAGAEEPT